MPNFERDQIVNVFRKWYQDEKDGKVERIDIATVDINDLGEQAATAFLWYLEN